MQMAIKQYIIRNSVLSNNRSGTFWDYSHYLPNPNKGVAENR
jgi:hypothetical protein